MTLLRFCLLTHRLIHTKSPIFDLVLGCERFPTSETFSLITLSSLASITTLTWLFPQMLLWIIMLIYILPYWLKPSCPGLMIMWELGWILSVFNISIIGLAWTAQVSEELLMPCLRSLEISAVLCFLNIWEKHRNVVQIMSHVSDIPVAQIFNTASKECEEFLLFKQSDSPVLVKKPCSVRLCSFKSPFIILSNRFDNENETVILSLRYTPAENLSWRFEPSCLQSLIIPVNRFWRQTSNTGLLPLCFSTLILWS